MDIKDLEKLKETLKLKEIDQLDAAILQFSKNTLATKRICATLLIGVSTIVLKITNDEIDYALYVGSIVTLIFFWIIDSNSYYYQRKLRIRMTEIVNDLRGNELISDGYGMPLKKKEKASWSKAFFNSSQVFYYLGFLIIILVALVDLIGWI
jgi:hypothetical protein